MALSPREYEELAGYRALRQFGSWKQGIHLGGAFDEQGIFDYEVTPSERSRTYPAGAAFTEQEGKAVLFMTPFCKRRGNMSKIHLEVEIPGNAKTYEFMLE